MPSSRPITRAARDLAQRLADDGVTAREIERWQQEYGLIEPPTQPTQDRYKTYSRDAESQARDVKRLLDDGRGLTLHQIAIERYVNGNYVSTEHLVRELLVAIRRTLSSSAPTRGWHQALPTAAALAHRYTSILKRDSKQTDLRDALRDAGRRAGETKTDTIERLMTSAVLSLTAGEPKTRTDLRQLLTALGLNPDWVDLEATSHGLARISQPELEKALTNASRAQLDQAATDSRLARHVLRANGVLVPPDHEAGVLTVGLLCIRNWVGDDLDWVLETIQKL